MFLMKALVLFKATNTVFSSKWRTAEAACACFAVESTLTFRNDAVSTLRAPLWFPLILQHDCQLRAAAAVRGNASILPQLLNAFIGAFCVEEETSSV